MAINLANAALSNLATAVTKLQIYTTSGGTLLLEFPTTDNVSNSTWTITAPTASTAIASGTPTFARLVDASNVVFLTGDVAATGTPWIKLGAVTSGTDYLISPSITITG